MQPMTFRAAKLKKTMLITIGWFALLIIMIIVYKTMFNLRKFPVLFIVMSVLYAYFSLSEYYRKLIVDEHGITVKRLFNATKTAKWHEISNLHYFILSNRPIEYIFFERDIDLLDSLFPSIIPKPYHRRTLILQEWDNHQQIKHLAEQNMQSAADNNFIVPFTVSFSDYMKRVFLFSLIMIPIMIPLLILWG
ncbi:hypothetical protein [Herpetosiphon giganteus]|uniref:hypothetical protein n=1 Tax=Herpetosiphon giganteus TaxID=2029754 RepID=UPI00195D0EF0|nr:hypothetical protein [Herpetosiphon giganteus]MBM7844045.1 hypothetical protein [Herpetosiphon giganteus]